MTDRFFQGPVRQQRLHAGPLGPHIDGFAAVLIEQGYSRQIGQDKLKLVSELSCWLQRKGYHARSLDERKVAQFLQYLWRDGRHPYPCIPRATLRQLLSHLQTTGAVAPPTEKIHASPIDRTLFRYSQYLTKERGFTQAGLNGYLPLVRLFLFDRFGAAAIRMSQVRPSDVTRFILRHTRKTHPKTAQGMITALRSFFRFLLLRGEIRVDLTMCLPSMAGWRLSKVPERLEPKQVESLLKTADRSTALGRRNYAILLLLARLGLRAGEVTNLTLDDINWDAGELTIRGKGGRLDRLPLPSDVGKALADYLRYGRHRCSTRRVFIRTVAPYREFAFAGQVSYIVQRALKQAHIQTVNKGAHLLRHSLASRMLREGASLTEIGEILRHHLVTTTEIYAKVDLVALRALAQPWPGGRHERTTESLTGVSYPTSGIGV